MPARAVSRRGDVQARSQRGTLPPRIFTPRGGHRSGQARVDRALSRERRQVRAPAVHRAVRPVEEHLDSRRGAREGPRQRADVRRLLDPRVQAHREVRHVLPSGPEHVPGAALGRARVRARRRASSATSPIRTARPSRATRACSSRRCSRTPRPRATTCRSGPRRSSSSSSAARRTGRRSTRTTRPRTSTSTRTISPRTRAATSRTS